MRKLALILLLALPAVAQVRYPQASPHAVLTQAVGTTDVTIDYHRPGVKGRQVWGGLVPYDKVWRTGANEATMITFSDDVTIDGKPLPKGTYSLHTIPGETEWTVIASFAWLTTSRAFIDAPPRRSIGPARTPSSL